jgi:hypothetical protein
MKDSLALLSTIDVERFYVCSVWEREVTLQGKASTELIQYCKGLGVDEFKVSDLGHLKAEIGKLKIVLA